MEVNEMEAHEMEANEMDKLSMGIVDTAYLKSIRIREGYKQKDMARLLGCQEGSYQRKETNILPFSHKEIAYLRTKLNMSTKEFIKTFFSV